MARFLRESDELFGEWCSIHGAEMQDHDCDQRDFLLAFKRRIDSANRALVNRVDQFLDEKEQHDRDARARVSLHRLLARGAPLLPDDVRPLGAGETPC